MARYIDANAFQKKLDEVTKEPNYQHENEDWSCGVCLAGVHLDCFPTADVVPRSEVDKVRLLAYESGKREVVREIHTTLLKEIIEARNSNFEAIRERETKHNVNRFEDTFCYYCNGKIHALDGIFYFVDEFLKKYEEDK